MVHKVVVPIPPPTRSISSALNDRAPLRINTLFWLSILFFLSPLGPSNGPKPFKNLCPGAPGNGQLLKLGFTKETVSIPAIRTPGDGESVKTSAHLLDLFRTQLARALTNQHSGLIIHRFAPFSHFGSFNGPSLSRESCRAAGKSGPIRTSTR